MKKLFYILFIFLIACSPKSDSQKNELTKLPNATKIKAIAAPAEPILTKSEPPSDTWTYDRIEGSILIFKEGLTYDTELTNLKYIGQIDIDQKAPFLIYSGRDCDECDANIALYFHSPRNGPLDVRLGENSYAYPGKQRDYETDSLVYQAQAFYGEVLNGVKGMVWYQKTLMEDNSFQNSIYLAKLEGDSIKEKEIKSYDQYLKQTLALNKAGKNKEIPGKDYTTQP